MYEMVLFDNKELLAKVQEKRYEIEWSKNEKLVFNPFYEDFSIRFCWSSNAIEGNTLSLDETISVIEYDEVRSGHTYTEYDEAKKLYKAIKKMIKPYPQSITKDWISETNGIIMGGNGNYRQNNLYVGTMVEAIYYPPEYTEVAKKMEDFLKQVNFQSSDPKEVIVNIAEQHIKFERIHPFSDGNGRTGRIILNQQMINHGFLPLTIEDQSKYRQAFRKYDINGDFSMLVYLLCKGELRAMEKIDELSQKLNASRIHKRNPV